MRSIFLGLALSTAAVATPALARDGRAGGKLVLTDGISTVEGAAGGGIATWAVIAGNETNRGIGASAHATLVALPDFTLKAYGAAVGAYDRFELSYTHQNFDTRKAGEALGLGRNFILSQDIIGAKARIIGDAIWDQDRWLPQIAVGAQHKISGQGAVVRAVGGRHRRGTDYFVSATKLILSRGVLLNGTARWTKANQWGLLGHGGDLGDKRTVQFEGSAGLMLSPSIVVGGEYRTKPDRLGFANEQRALDGFAAWSVQRNVTVTAAYADLGSIATFKRQRGLYLSLQGAF